MAWGYFAAAAAAAADICSKVGLRARTFSTTSSTRSSFMVLDGTVRPWRGSVAEFSTVTSAIRGKSAIDLGAAIAKANGAMVDTASNRRPDIRMMQWTPDRRMCVHLRIGTL